MSQSSSSSKSNQKQKNQPEIQKCSLISQSSESEPSKQNLDQKKSKNPLNKLTNEQVKLQENTRLFVKKNNCKYEEHSNIVKKERNIFNDIREDVLTAKVDNALFKLQQIDDQRYALKFLGLKFFLQYMRKFTYSHRSKNISKLQKHLIRDISLAENNIQRGNKQNSNNEAYIDEEKSSLIQKLLQLFPLFNPSNTFLVVWDIIQLIFILIFFYAIPLQITFKKGLGEFMSGYVFNLGIVLFMIDNIICLNTTYFEKGVLVQNRRKIFSNYIQHHFITDFLSNIPVLIDYFFTQLVNAWGLLMLIQFLKNDRIELIIRKLEEFFHLTPTQQQLVSLFKLLVTVLFIAHIFACIWIYIAIGEDASWLIKQGIEQKLWTQQYLLAYYFSTVTMITVGYGDVLPTTQNEYILCIITMLISCGVFAYAVNQIGSIFELLGRQDKQLKEMMYRISNYMHIKKVSKELQYEIREYLQYYWREEQNRDTEQEEKIINQLSDSLKDSLILEANNLVLKDSIVFKSNFSEAIIKKTVPLIKESRITPEEQIVYEGFVDDSCIYFIEKGRCEVFIDQFSQGQYYTQQIKKLKSGDSFGLFSFFTGNQRKLSIRSLDFTTLLQIKRQDFLNLLKDHPEDYQRYCQIKDKILNSEDFRQLGVRCYSCGDIKHLVENCPFIHLVYKRFQFIKKLTSSVNQERQQKKRTKRKRQNSRLIMNLIMDQAEEIQANYSIILEELFGDLDCFGESEENEEILSDSNFILDEKRDKKDSNGSGNGSGESQKEEKKEEVSIKNRSSSKGDDYISSRHDESNIQLRDSDEINSLSVKKNLENSNVGQLQFIESYLRTDSRRNSQTKKFTIKIKDSSKKEGIQKQESLNSNCDKDSISQKQPGKQSILFAPKKSTLVPYDQSNQIDYVFQNKLLNLISNQQKREEAQIIEGTDNKNQFYSIFDFDSLKNFQYYFPMQNSLYIIKKFQIYQMFKFQDRQNMPLFNQQQKLQAKSQQPIPSLVNLEYRKINKRGGTKVGGGFISNNLIKKFQEEERNNEEQDSMQSDQTGDNSPFAIKNHKKNNKRHGSILTPIFGLEQSEEQKNQLKVNSSIFSKFQSSQKVIQEENDNSEEECQSQESSRKNKKKKKNQDYQCQGSIVFTNLSSFSSRNENLPSFNNLPLENIMNQRQQMLQKQY